MERIDEEKYIQGFNEGYLVAKYAPELSQKLSEIKSQAPRLEGLLDGIQQYALELTKDRLPPFEKDYQKEEHKHDTPNKEKGMEPPR